MPGFREGWVPGFREGVGTRVLGGVGARVQGGVGTRVQGGVGARVQGGVDFRGGQTIDQAEVGGGWFCPAPTCSARGSSLLSTCGGSSRSSLTSARATGARTASPSTCRQAEQAAGSRQSRQDGRAPLNTPSSGGVSLLTGQKAFRHTAPHPTPHTLHLALHLAQLGVPINQTTNQLPN